MTEYFLGDVAVLSTEHLFFLILRASCRVHPYPPLLMRKLSLRKGQSLCQGLPLIRVLGRCALLSEHSGALRAPTAR